MSPTPPTQPTRTHLRPTLVRALVVAIVVATATLVGAASATADGGDIGGAGVIDLAPVDQGVAPATGQQELASGGGSIVPADESGGAESEGFGADPAIEAPPTGATGELELERARLVTERNRLQAALLDEEDARDAAEQRHADALAAIAARIVQLFDAGEDARVAALIAVRDEQDPEARAELAAALDARDRALVTRLDDAATAVDRAAATADATRARVLAVGTRIDAIAAVLDERRGPTASELAREQGKRFTIDADYVFATGPIPSIGYWGAMNGGSFLDGWQGFAGAAVGGIGCTPPDPTLQPTGTVESGEASWYGPGFDGQNTASGEVFDTTQLTAAHKTLPFGTLVRVYSSTTARCVFVRINDRGPYVDGRVIDLSRAAADAIGMESVAPVQLEVYAPPAAPAQ